MERKRKRTQVSTKARKVVKRDTPSDDAVTVEDEILQLEADAADSAYPRSSIQQLLHIFYQKEYGRSEKLAAAVALCRIYYRLIATNVLVRANVHSQVDREKFDWLMQALKSYTDRLGRLLQSRNGQLRSTALTLFMRLVKAETSRHEDSSMRAWERGIFRKLVDGMISLDTPDEVREEFAETYLEEHDDVRFYTFEALQHIIDLAIPDPKVVRKLLPGILDLILRVEGIPDSADQLQDWYGLAPGVSSKRLRSLAAHRKQAQETWQALFRSGLDTSQRKRLLDVLTVQIAPWFQRPEALMDFLTDSYNQSGATSLLALEGIFFLIKERNLDYPQFYHKLYSLLDDDILHSRYRAKFFRLLEVFLASTHLPAALVASFIKRLSRLALTAPPGGIVMVVPWVYNMLRTHPQCTFMVHRLVRTTDERQELEAVGMDDPFRMDEQDPMSTDAIESSLWELHTLQRHHQPNVAMLARIVGEQFTKQEYHLDDFLDHTYDGLIEGELGKTMKKAPVVEFEIPKRIFTMDGGELNHQGALLLQALQC